MENLIQMLAIRSAIKLATANDRIRFHSHSRCQACIVPGAVAAPICALQVCSLCKKDHQVNERLHDRAAQEPRPGTKSVNRRLLRCGCVVVTRLVAGNALHLIFDDGAVKHRNPHAFQFLIIRINKAHRLVPVTLRDGEIYHPVAAYYILLLVNLHGPCERTAVIRGIGHVRCRTVLFQRVIVFIQLVIRRAV